jgi:hypothetical protein
MIWKLMKVGDDGSKRKTQVDSSDEPVEPVHSLATPGPDSLQCDLSENDAMQGQD